MNSSKEKAMAKMGAEMKSESAPKADGKKLSKHEERNRKARFTVHLEKKKVDGKEVVSAKLERDTADMGFYGMETIGKPGDKPKEPPKPPIPIENTDIPAFCESLKAELLAAAKQIMAVKD